MTDTLREVFLDCVITFRGYGKESLHAWNNFSVTHTSVAELVQNNKMFEERLGKVFNVTLCHSQVGIELDLSENFHLRHNKYVATNYTRKKPEYKYK